MADDLENLKATLWKHFKDASSCADDIRYGTIEGRAANRNAAGVIGLAIVSIEKEMRERAETAKPPALKPALRLNNR